MQEPLIKSKRLFLRRLRIENISDEYVQWLNDFETTKYLEVRFTPQTREGVEKYIRRCLLEKTNTYHLGVFVRNTDQLIGTVTFNYMDMHHMSAAVSFVIGYPCAGGKGYATEALHAATYHMFYNKNFVKLWGGYYEGHHAAEKVFYKNGYKVEGRLKHKLINDEGERVDHILVGLLSYEFVLNKGILGVE